MKDLLSILGFLLAGFCFFVWYGERSGATTSDNTKVNQGMIADANGFNAGDVFTERPLERPDEVTRNGESAKAADRPAEGTSANTRLTTDKIRNQVQQIADAAMSSAVEYQIPAGTSLALLIYSAERGKQITSSNLSRVVEYLMGVKQSADEQDRRSYFKYASNSEKWFQGLGFDRNGGHPKSDLLRIYNAYDLKNYDKDVLAFVTSPSKSKAKSSLKFDQKIEPKTVAPSLSGDVSNEELRRNHAYAKNRWADQEIKGTSADVKFVASETYSKNKANAARQQVEKLSVGQSITFDNPGEYHAAVKEIIALEAGLDSWEVYENKAGRESAEKVFRRRAEKGGFLVTGTLKVTRER